MNQIQDSKKNEKFSKLSPKHLYEPERVQLLED